MIGSYFLFLQDNVENLLLLYFARFLKGLERIRRTNKQSIGSSRKISYLIKIIKIVHSRLVIYFEKSPKMMTELLPDYELDFVT